MCLWKIQRQALFISANRKLFNCEPTWKMCVNFKLDICWFFVQTMNLGGGLSLKKIAEGGGFSFQMIWRFFILLFCLKGSQALGKDDLMWESEKMPSTEVVKIGLGELEPICRIKIFTVSLIPLLYVCLFVSLFLSLSLSFIIFIKLPFLDIQ